MSARVVKQRVNLESLRRRQRSLLSEQKQEQPHHQQVDASSATPSLQNSKQTAKMMMRSSRRSSQSPSFSYRAAVLVLAVIFCTLPFLLSFFAIADLDTCAVERFTGRSDWIADVRVRNALPASLNNVNRATHDLDTNELTPKSSNGSSLDGIEELDANHNAILLEAELERQGENALPTEPSMLASLKLGHQLASMATNRDADADAEAAAAASHADASFQPTSIMLILLLACCLIKAFVPSKPSSSSSSSSSSAPAPYATLFPVIHAVKVLLAYQWYLAAYFLCNALKGYLADSSCNTHPNSVSGHYLFHLYALFALFHIHAAQTRSLMYSVHSLKFWRLLFRSHQSKFFMFFFLAYMLSSSLILMNTYLLGYHSMRQIMYGVCMAFVSHWMMMEVLDLLDALIELHLERAHAASSSNSLMSSQKADIAHSKSLESVHSVHFGLTTSQKADIAHRVNAASMAAAAAAATDNEQLISSMTALTNSAQMRKRTLSQMTPPLEPAGSLASILEHSSLPQRHSLHFSPLQRALCVLFAQTLRLSEEHGHFFIFPFIIIFVAQVAAFVALLASPAHTMWRAADIGVLLLTWALMAYLYFRYLRLPVLSAQSFALR